MPSDTVSQREMSSSIESPKVPAVLGMVSEVQLELSWDSSKSASQVRRRFVSLCSDQKISLSIVHPKLWVVFDEIAYPAIEQPGAVGLEGPTLHNSVDNEEV